MENGSYRASDVDTFGMGTWRTVNFDALPHDIVEALMPNGDELTQVLPLPEEPEEDEFENEEEYQQALAEWEEEIEQQEESRGLPMWGTMWVAENSGAIVEDLLDCGFTVFTPDYGPLAESYDGCVIFGVDGAGYSFMGQHWIPLRAARLFRIFAAGYLKLDDLECAITKLMEESGREGETGNNLLHLLQQARAAKAQ